MAIYQALGTSPISFVDGNQNQQELPLSAVFFTANGVDASASPLNTAANQALLSALLQQIVSQGFLVPVTLPITAASMTVTAAQTGSMGNSITATFANPSTTAGTVTVTAVANEVYEGLTPATLGTTLGTSAATATGLIFVESDNGQMPEAFAGAIGSGPGFDLAVPEAADNTKTAFTVAATNQSPPADAENIKITVAPDSSAIPTTFTLTVNWTKTSRE